MCRSWMDGRNTSCRNLWEDSIGRWTEEPLVEIQSRSEIENPIEKLKNDKAPGQDGIGVELLESGEKNLYKVIHRMVC